MTLSEYIDSKIIPVIDIVYSHGQLTIQRDVRRSGQLFQTKNKNATFGVIIDNVLFYTQKTSEVTLRLRCQPGVKDDYSIVNQIYYGICNMRGHCLMQRPRIEENEYFIQTDTQMYDIVWSILLPNDASAFPVTPRAVTRAIYVRSSVNKEGPIQKIWKLLAGQA